MLERIGNLDCEFKNPGFESKYAVLSKKRKTCLCYTNVLSASHDLAWCHHFRYVTIAFHHAYFCFVTRLEWVWLYVLEVVFWAHFPFHSGWIAAISGLIWRCVGGPWSERARKFPNLGLPEEKEKSSLKLQNITAFIRKSVKTLSNRQRECNSMSRKCL